MLTRVLGQAACGLFFLLAGAGVASAGSFTVSPVRATLSASQSVAALTVHNTGTEPAVLQLEVLSWAQQEGKDVYMSKIPRLSTGPLHSGKPAQRASALAARSGVGDDRAAGMGGNVQPQRYRGEFRRLQCVQQCRSG